RDRKPDLADRLERFVGVVGLAVLVLLIVGIALGERDRIVDLAVAVGPPVIVLNLALIVLGGLLAWVCRLSRAAQIAVSVELSIKNTTLTMLIAFTVIGNEEVGLAAAVYSLVMYLTAFGLAYGGRRVMRTTALGDPREGRTGAPWTPTGRTLPRCRRPLNRLPAPPRSAPIPPRPPGQGDRTQTPRRLMSRRRAAV